MINFRVQEHVKHRITGFIVLLSIMLILLPALISKSNERAEKERRFSLQTTMPKPKAMTFKIEKIAAPVQLAENTVIVEPKPVVVEPEPVIVEPAPVIVEPAPIVVAPQRAVVAPRPAVTPRINPRRPLTEPLRRPRATLKSELFAVQVASFVEQKNALNLIKSLKQKGFSANYKLVRERGHLVYKVTVGSMQNRLQALQLQQKLAETAQVRGFIVQTEVV